MAKKDRILRGGAGCIIVSIVILLIVMVLIIVYFSELQPRDPAITVTLKPANSNPNVPVAQMFGLALCLNLSVHNPNNAAFHYWTVQASVSYNGREIGFLLIPGGEVRPKTTTKFTMYLAPTQPSNWLSDPSLDSANVSSHILTLEADVYVSGEVKALGSFVHHSDSANACIVNISTVSNAVIAYYCQATM